MSYRPPGWRDPDADDEALRSARGLGVAFILAGVLAALYAIAIWSMLS